MKSNHNDFGESLRLATSAMRASAIAEEMKKNQKIIEEANQKAILLVGSGCIWALFLQVQSRIVSTARPRQSPAFPPECKCHFKVLKR